MRREGLLMPALSLHATAVLCPSTAWVPPGWSSQPAPGQAQAPSPAPLLCPFVSFQGQPPMKAKPAS